MDLNMFPTYPRSTRIRLYLEALAAGDPTLAFHGDWEGKLITMQSSLTFPEGRLMIELNSIDHGTGAVKNRTE